MPYLWFAVFSVVNFALLVGLTYVGWYISYLVFVEREPERLLLWVAVAIAALPVAVVGLGLPILIHRICLGFVAIYWLEGRYFWQTPKDVRPIRVLQAK